MEVGHHRQQFQILGLYILLLDSMCLPLRLHYLQSLPGWLCEPSSWLVILILGQMQIYTRCILVCWSFTVYCGLKSQPVSDASTEILALRNYDHEQYYGNKWLLQPV
uniref:Uncharacterized protein n=1 Tax=Arundo donax TaxID=35708 RepID=A0A0A9HKG5_ARUDO